MLHYLISERVQEANGIHLEDGMDATCVGLEVLEDMVREELNHIYKRICRGYPMLQTVQTKCWSKDGITVANSQNLLTCVVLPRVATAVIK